MTLRISGPDVGDRIGHLAIRDVNDMVVTLNDIPGMTLVVDMFRGHW